MSEMSQCKKPTSNGWKTAYGSVSRFIEKWVCMACKAGIC